MPCTSAFCHPDTLKHKIYSIVKRWDEDQIVSSCIVQASFLRPVGSKRRSRADSALAAPDFDVVEIRHDSAKFKQASCVPLVASGEAERTLLSLLRIFCSISQSLLLKTICNG